MNSYKQIYLKYKKKYFKLKNYNGGSTFRIIKDSIQTIIDIKQNKIDNLSDFLHIIESYTDNPSDLIIVFSQQFYELKDLNDKIFKEIKKDFSIIIYNNYQDLLYQDGDVNSLDIFVRNSDSLSLLKLLKLLHYLLLKNNNKYNNIIIKLLDKITTSIQKIIDNILEYNDIMNKILNIDKINNNIINNFINFSVTYIEQFYTKNSKIIDLKNININILLQIFIRFIYLENSNENIEYIYIIKNILKYINTCFGILLIESSMHILESSIIEELFKIDLNIQKYDDFLKLISLLVSYNYIFFNFLNTSLKKNNTLIKY
jgi:hypothetical protein